MANEHYTAGKLAFLAGKTEADNPFINGKTKLGNPKLAEGGEDWFAGFRDAKPRPATAKELAAVEIYDVSRFRRKRNRYYEK